MTYREKQETLREAKESLATLLSECKSLKEELSGVNNRLRSTEEQLRGVAKEINAGNRQLNLRKELEATHHAIACVIEEIKGMEISAKNLNEELDDARARGGKILQAFEILVERFVRVRELDSIQQMLNGITEMLRLHVEDDALAVTALENRDDLDRDLVRAATDLVAEIRAKINELMNLSSAQSK